ncbi:MAG: hypothetical protein Q7W30_04045 [Coriobacteriia bacterium]|nr:hypothetical protein [Coriobacteriia bacterium]
MKVSTPVRTFVTIGLFCCLVFGAGCAAQSSGDLASGAGFALSEAVGITVPDGWSGTWDRWTQSERSAMDPELELQMMRETASGRTDSIRIGVFASRADAAKLIGLDEGAAARSAESTDPAGVPAGGAMRFESAAGPAVARVVRNRPETLEEFNPFEIVVWLGAESERPIRVSASLNDYPGTVPATAGDRELATGLLDYLGLARDGGR